MSLIIDQDSLKKRILETLIEQGFHINPHVRIKYYNRDTARTIQQKARQDQISSRSEFLTKSIDKVREYNRDGVEISPEQISLELREVYPGTIEELLFRWWNLVWWSIPFQRSYGRQMRYLLWDKTHQAPFGLICLQSPVLSMNVRDKALGIPKSELDKWVNMSMNAQRVGALPPYNELIGGKMVALALTSNELRDNYRRKYNGYVTCIQKRKLDPSLLFITTTSAFGRSSIYNRLNYNREVVAERLGYTKGSGTFHLPEQLYREVLDLLSQNGIDISRGYGHGPSRKLRLISSGFRLLGLSNYHYHGIKREFFLFALVKNLKDVIQHNQKPIWLNRSFDELTCYWKERWAVPRAIRMHTLKNYKKEDYFNYVYNELLSIKET